MFKVQSIQNIQKFLTSFILCYFHCLAIGELKPRTKQSGGAHISTTICWAVDTGGERGQGERQHHFSTKPFLYVK